MIWYFLIIFQIFFEYIKTGISKDCEIGNYCSNGVACSTNGNCKIDIFNMNNETLESQCICNVGFSSYDIEVLEEEDSEIYCCYEQKSHFTAFMLEIFLGFGIGHFYIGDIKFGLIKCFIQISLCFSFCYLTYRACTQEHTLVINLNDLNKKEEYKMNENIDNDELKELNDNFDNDKNSENESKNQNEEENQLYELLSKDLIKCPVFKFFIFLSLSCFILIQIIDVMILGLGYYKDEKGENLAMWY